MKKVLLLIMIAFFTFNPHKESINNIGTERMKLIRGIGQKKAEFIVNECSKKPFKNDDDFLNRTKGVIGEKSYKEIKKVYAIK